MKMGSHVRLLKNKQDRYVVFFQSVDYNFGLLTFESAKIAYEYALKLERSKELREQADCLLCCEAEMISLK